jgi:flagellar protein FliS
MKPHILYKSRQATGWTRVDMLLAIYDGAIRAIDQGIAATVSYGAIVPPVHRLQAQKLLLLLLEGVNPRTGTAADYTQKLLVFCTEQIQSSASADWMTARKVLNCLREAFQEVREEARRMEESGAIPRLDWSGVTPELARA